MGRCQAAVGLMGPLPGMGELETGHGPRRIPTAASWRPSWPCPAALSVEALARPAWLGPSALPPALDQAWPSVGNGERLLTANSLGLGWPPSGDSWRMAAAAAAVDGPVDDPGSGRGLGALAAAGGP